MLPAIKARDKKLPWILILSFLIPAAVICAVYIINGVDPFGNMSILYADAKIQYKDYYGYLWEVLHGNASLDYSASKSLGGQMVGLVVYYLTCPLNLLLYFINKSQIPLFISIVTAVKIAFSGLTASYFARKRFNTPALASILIASCYALSEYSLEYSHNIMWLDGVVMLPLACLGVYELLYNNKKGLLFFSVFAAIFSNWYSGYMVCLMTGFCFIFEIAQKYDFKNFKGVIKPVVKDTVSVASDMILGVLASGIILVPGLLSLVGGKANGKMISGIINVRFIESLKGFMINADANKKDAPIMYCGAIILVLAVYMFLDKKTDVKKRILSAVSFAFMLCSFCFDQLNIMWTGFVKSYSYQFRWAFVFIFLMIYFACVCVNEIRKHGFDKITMFKALGIITALFLVLDAAEFTKKTLVSYFYIALIIAYGIAVVVMYALKNKRFLKSAVALAICVVTIAELTYNGAKVFEMHVVDKKDDFVNYTNEMESVIDDIQTNDTSFYRLEKNASYLTELGRNVASSESFMYNYSGISGYTSTYDANVDIFLAKMGYSDSTSITPENQTEKKYNATETYWNSPQLVMDSILGIKYQILDKSAPGLEEYDHDSILDGRYKVYENPYALPLAFNVSSDLYNDIEYGQNPFENQEKFVSAALGKDVSLFFKPDYKNGTMSNNEQKITVHIKKDGPLYFYTDPSECHEKSTGDACQLYVDGEKIDRICMRFCTNAIYLGDYKAGDTVKVSIKMYPGEDGKEKTHKVYLEQLDVSAAENALKELASGSSSTLNFSKNTVSGTYETENDSTVLLTVPYTDGWDLYVDGEKYDYSQIGDTFIGIDLSAGSHQIEMKYTTKHRNAGIASCVVGFGGFAVWCAVDILKRRKSEVK